MLWSLVKILLFVALVAGLTLGAGYILDTSGGIRVAVANTEFSLGPLQSIVAVLLLIVALWLLFKLAGLLIAVLKFLNGDDTAFSRHFRRTRQRKGLQALSEGMLALASGEGRLAMSKASKAAKYLDHPEMTDLLIAQAAEMEGDRHKAEEVYKRLLPDERTRFIGVHGIMKQKLADGDSETAMKLAEKAFALKPRHEETQDLLLRLQASTGHWSEARRTLNAKLKYGSLPRDVHKRRDAVLALSQARAVMEEGNSIEAREAAIEANRLSPDLIPAAVLAARSYIEQDKPRYAARVIRKTWEVQPHPDLAAAFADIAPDETPEERIKRFHTLTRINSDHPETRMLVAELNIAAEDFPAARRALGDLVSTHPTARSLTIMAAIERGEGAEESVVRGWLTKALAASRGPQWVCENCHYIHGQWAPVCSNCGAFDTLAWKVPTQGEIAMPKSSEMLPLITSGPEKRHGEDNLPAPRGAEPGAVAATTRKTAETPPELARPQSAEAAEPAPGDAGEIAGQPGHSAPDGKATVEEAELIGSDDAGAPEGAPPRSEEEQSPPRRN